MERLTEAGYGEMEVRPPTATDGGERDLKRYYDSLHPEFTELVQRFDSDTIAYLTAQGDLRVLLDE